jgi:hypothetical protein
MRALTDRAREVMVLTSSNNFLWKGYLVACGLGVAPKGEPLHEARYIIDTRAHGGLLSQCQQS